MTAMARKSRIGSALLMSGLLGAALAVGVPAPPAGATDGQPTAPEPSWGSCERFLGQDSDVLPDARCATLSVPVDYANPTGPQAQLALIKIPATGKRIGALLVNPGGPGASAVDALAALGWGWPDPRSPNTSTWWPSTRAVSAIRHRRCAAAPTPNSMPGAASRWWTTARRGGPDRAAQPQPAQECLDKMGREFLAGVGTDSAARDMDVVRQALGDDQINFLGFSYGTDLGASYLEKFPNRVRAMVLDGAIDPAEDPMASITQQMTGFQVAFNDYAADCAKSVGCPLGTDPAQWVTRYHQLVDPLVAKPGPTSDPRGLSYQDAITGTFNALYTPEYWKFLTSGLLGLARHTDAGDLLLLADEYQGRDDYGRYNNGQDAFNAIRCVDAPTPTDPAAWPISTGGPGSWRRSRPTAFTGFARATSARSGRFRRRVSRIPRRPPRPAASSWCPPPTTPRRRTRPA